jgi:signal transduction histidine kinase
LFGFVFLDDLYLSARSDSLKQTANKLISDINSPDLASFAYEISQKENISVIIINHRGGIYSDINFVSSQTSIAGYTASERLEFFNKAMLSSSGTHSYTSVGTGENPVRTLVFASIVRTAGGDDLAVVAATTVPLLQSALGTIIPMLLAASALVLIIAFVVALLLYRTIAKPIELLTSAAGDLARGKADIEIKVNGFKEVRELTTTLNYASKELSKTEHLRKELIANVSHDLRTPLTLITSYAEMIKDFPDKITEEDIQVVIDEAERLKNLVESIQNLGSLQHNTEKGMVFKILDLVPILKEIVSRHTALLKHNGYIIELEHGESARVYADEQSISQVIYNLLSNAVNYAGDDKLIKVRQIRKGSYIRVEVIDQGIGIDVDNIPHIWDRYFKSKQNHRRAHLGTGLGLSIVKSIISQHPGGIYGVKSSVGKGSTFYFELPIANRLEIEG